jgi:CRP/FNR family transcriptional regulator
LDALEAEYRRTLARSSRVLQVPANSVVFSPGSAPEHLLLLLEGTIRIQQTSSGGREIVLYRITAGECCVLTMVCLMASEEYSAEGLSETEAKAVAVPRDVFDDLMARSQVFRQFVFNTYSSRITELFLTIQEVAFSRIDIRLAQKLLELAGAAGALSMTHYQLSVELGSAREVISRQLQEFQRRGWVSLERGKISVIDAGALRALGREA